MKPKSKISRVRVRGFQCTKEDCGVQIEVFSNDTPPLECEVCGTTLSQKPEYDILVTARKHTEDYKD